MITDRQAMIALRTIETNPDSDDLGAVCEAVLHVYLADIIKPMMAVHIAQQIADGV